MSELYPSGNVMTPDQFMQSAFDQPESGLATFGGAAADAANQTSGLGTVLRSFNTPDLAWQIQPHGRGGVTYNYSSSDQVAAQGDTLYQDEAQFKSSPYYRPEIPFEKGMTASRAKALADQKDLSNVREYFGSKRPWTNFAGALVGSAIDPLNYVPVVDGATGTMAIGRLGKIAGRALVGSADAALNAAAGQVLTAPIRQQFGDDTSWTATMKNAAFAAMAGAVFGGVHGALSKNIHAPVVDGAQAPRPDVAGFSSVNPLLSRLETKAMKGKSADVMNDAVFGMIHDGEVKLGERSQGHIADMQDMAAKPITEPLPINFKEVSRDVALISPGKEVPVRYAVVEAHDLTASQRDAGGVNPAYPAELQPRNRERIVSQAQIQQIAQNLDPRLLDKSPKASDGAPIVAKSGVVESGNGRVLAIRRAYQAGSPAAERYKNHLASQGYPVDGMKNPVLVRIRDSEMNSNQRQAFTRAANERDTLAMSGTERAMADSSAMPDGMLELYRGGEISDAGNRNFVKSFIRDIVSENDRGSMVSAEGAMSQEATRRIEAALLAKAYKDSNIVSSLIESTDTNIRAIGGALMDVAPSWARLRSEVAKGEISPDVDLTPNLLEAVRMVQMSRRDGKPMSMLVGQKDIFSGKTIDPKSEAFLRLMFRDTDNWKSPIGRERLSESLRFYVDEARKTSPGVDMLGMGAADPKDILNVAKRKQFDGQAPQDGFQFNGNRDIGQGADQTSAGGAGQEIQSRQDGGGGEAGQSRQPVYTSPAPEPELAGLRDAYGQLDAAIKSDLKPDAQINGMVADAKAQGFDPLTNENDMALDLVAFRDQGLLTAEDEAALKAADEAHTAVDAWAGVMNVARECVLK